MSSVDGVRWLLAFTVVEHFKSSWLWDSVAALVREEAAVSTTIKQVIVYPNTNMYCHHEPMCQCVSTVTSSSHNWGAVGGQEADTLDLI